MISQEFVLTDELNILYQESEPDLGFDQVLSHFQIETDAQLADLIEADGRLRLRLGESVPVSEHHG